jgi:hypothetical protein
MSHIAVFEPDGLAHADRFALALMRLERRISGTPVTLLHLDPNLRGLTSSSSSPAWTGLSGSTANLSAALSTLARGKRPMLQATPLPQGEGQMIWPGALLEEAWQEASLAVARSAHTIALREPLLTAIRAVQPGPSWVSLLGPARSGPAALMLAEMDTLVLPWTGGTSAALLKAERIEVVKQILSLRREKPVRLLGVRIGGPPGAGADYWGLLAAAAGHPNPPPLCNLLDPDPTIEAIVAALRPTWLRIHGLAP